PPPGPPPGDPPPGDPPPGPPPPGGPPPGSGSEGAAAPEPAFEEPFRLLPNVFRLATTLARVKPDLARGTVFAYSLSEPAKVTIEINRLRPGRVSGGVCRRPSRKLARKPACTIPVPVGVLRHNAAAGRNRFAFTGRIGRRPLLPGRYRATATAVDGAGNESHAANAAFRVVAR
ncbi:MAG: hypothetical protein M3340_05130, partial [Actinomycetota bacterium]|nr:hypothetical protein [Actinomycetota bacterium]